jgi:multiple sugar transport system ATP-binding protein
MDLDAARWSAALADWAAGSDLLLGIRPQDLLPVDGEPRAPSFEASIHLTEPLGDVTVLDLEAGGAILKMVLPEERAVAYAAGDRLRVALAPADAHLFSKESGVLISPMPGDARPAE